MNRRKLVSHMACTKTDFHIVGIYRNKNDAVRSLRYTRKPIQVRYNAQSCLCDQKRNQPQEDHSENSSLSTANPRRHRSRIHKHKMDMRIDLAIS